MAEKGLGSLESLFHEQTGFGRYFGLGNHGTTEDLARGMMRCGRDPHAVVMLLPAHFKNAYPTSQAFPK